MAKKVNLKDKNSNKLYLTSDNIAHEDIKLDKIINYSSDEMIVGTWIDGSKIYRKCYDTTIGELGTGSSSNELTRSIRIDNFSRLINTYGIVLSNYNNWWTIPSHFSATNYNIYLYCSNTLSINIEFGSYFSTSSEVKLVLYYLKEE